jgi:addiction module HigA family antidote
MASEAVMPGIANYNAPRYSRWMIQSFADPETELIWSGRRSRKLPADIQNVALRKLRFLNQARVLGDLLSRPAIALRRYGLIGRDNTRSGSTTSGAYVLYGTREDLHMSKSSTIMARSSLLANPHPGEILLEEFLKPMGLSQNALARSIHVAPRRINEIVLGKRDVTADTDLRLARYFGLSEGFFLGLQMDYDLMQRRREIDRDLKTIRPRAA